MSTQIGRCWDRGRRVLAGLGISYLNFASFVFPLSDFRIQPHGIADMLHEPIKSSCSSLFIFRIVPPNPGFAMPSCSSSWLYDKALRDASLIRGLKADSSLARAKMTAKYGYQLPKLSFLTVLG